MNNKKILIVLPLVILILSVSALGQTISPEHAVEDARYLRETLESIHPDLYFTRDRGESEKQFREIVAELKTRKSWTKKELFGQLAPYVASFEDGHTFLSIMEDFRKHAFQGGKIFPLSIKIDEGEITVTANHANSGPSPGAIIKSINGVSSDELYARMAGVIGSKRRAHLESTLSSGFPVYVWALYDFENSCDITYKNQAGVEKTALLTGLSVEQLKAKRGDGAGEENLKWSLSFPRNDVALLTINTFAGSLKDEFETFVQKSFERIEASEAEFLIIDLRNNGGGSTELSDYLYSFVSARPFRTFAEVRVKLSEPIKKRLAETRPEIDLPEKETVTYKSDLQAPPERTTRFEGELFVLTGPRTFSTSTDFAAIIKDYGVGEIAGEETGGLASSYGDIYYDRLPNSELKFGVSFKYFLRPAGFDNGRGVIPDIRISLDGLDNGKEDTVIATLLEKI